MNLSIKKEELGALREKYPPGCRVELVKMDDPYREMPPGLRGVVTGIDDSGSIHVQKRWQGCRCIFTDIRITAGRRKRQTTRCIFCCMTSRTRR